MTASDQRVSHALRMAMRYPLVIFSLQEICDKRMIAADRFFQERDKAVFAWRAVRFSFPIVIIDQPGILIIPIGFKPTFPVFHRAVRIQLIAIEAIELLPSCPFF
jgi:hypothetical protein